MEVIPGESVTGTVNTELISDSLVKPVMNRAYLDQYTFYIPFRLLWDGWVEFIQGNGGTIPTTTCNIARLGYNNKSGDSVNAFMLSAYNLIWNTFFRDQDESEVALTNAAVQRVSLRQSTFLHRLQEVADYDDQTVDTSSGGFTPHELDVARTQERFNRIRNLYGDKYSDYLATVGVSTSWSVVDQPDSIGITNSELTRKMVFATDDTPAARGIFMGKNTVNVRKSFFPEHGLVMSLACMRIEASHNDEVGPVVHQKENYQDFWNPEFEALRESAYPHVLDDGTTYSPTFLAPRYEDYRVPQNLCFIAGDTTYVHQRTTPNTANTATSLDLRKPEFTDFGVIFQGDTSRHYTTQTIVRLTRMSPCKPQRMLPTVSGGAPDGGEDQQ